MPDNYKDRLLLFDFMNTKEKENILSISDVTVLASTFENSPIALNESLCTGIPVIVSKYCGFSDYMGGTEEYTVFNPFVNNDLCRQIKRFYELSAQERENIAMIQLSNLASISAEKNTVDKRLDLYFSVTARCFAAFQNILILNCESYLLPVTEDLLSVGFNNAMFFFGSSNFSESECLKLFENLSGSFKDKEIIAFGGGHTYLSLDDFIVYDIPFIVKGIRISKEMLGLPLWKAVLFQIDINAETYCLTGRLENNAVAHSKQISKLRKEDIKRRLLSYLFMEHNRVKMEDLYAD